MTRGNVPPVRPRTKDEVSNDLATDWLPMAPIGKRKEFAAQIGLGEDGYKTVSAAISGEHLPAAHTIFNSLVVSETALFNVLLGYGGVFVRCGAGTTGDMATISGMLHAATDYLDRMKDGQRCHVDTAALAKLFTPLVPAMLAIIQEANGQKSGAKLRAVAS